jgi:hypothetical protein
MNGSVYRVHWLKSRAQLHRWEEELDLTQHEMVWTVGYFIHKAVEWEGFRNMAQAAIRPGPAAYAEKQIHLWRSLSKYADIKYVVLCPGYSQLA